MATTEDVIILKVGTDEAVKSVNDLKENVKLLKNNLGELEIGSEEYKETLEELKINQNALKDAMYATTGTMEDVAAAATGASKSYNSLVHQMAALKEEWRATNDEARRNELGKQIAEVNQKLKDMDASVGNYQRNVGNYSSALDGLKEGFLATAGGAGAVINPVKNVTMGFKALSATPVIGILGLLANILTKVIDNLNSSEENTNRLTTALAPLKAGANLVTKAFQFLGEKLADVSEWFTKLLDKFGLISEEGKKYQEIVEEEISLVEKRREVEMANADAQLEIAKLKAQAAEKDKYTASERLQFIEAAAQKEKEIAERNIELARREYAVLEEKSKLAGNSKEENDKLAQAYVTLQKAETDYFNKTKELNAQRVEALNAIKAESKATEELAEKKLELADAEKALREGESKRMEALKLRAAEEKAIAKDIEADWEEVHDEIDAWYEEEDRKRREDIDATKKAEEEKAAAKVATLQAVASATSSILYTIADMYESDTEASEKELKKAKNLRIVGATIDMLSGVVTAISTAMSLGPIAGPIVGAVNSAAVIAAGVANIAKIKSQSTSASSGGGGGNVSATVSAPTTSTNIPTIRTATSASEEDRLNRMASPQKVYILQSDIEAAGSQSKTQIEESSF